MIALYAMITAQKGGGKKKKKVLPLKNDASMSAARVK